MSYESPLIPGKLAYQVDEAADLIGVSRSTLYKAQKRGDLKMGKLYGRTVIAAVELEAFFKSSYQPMGATG